MAGTDLSVLEMYWEGPDLHVITKDEAHVVCKSLTRACYPEGAIQESDAPAAASVGEVTP